MLELSDVVADGKPTRTLAIESEDASKVTALVRTMGFEGWINTSYLRGLSALVNDEPERYAVIDVGTNSVKFHVAERTANGGWQRIADRGEITRLGEGLEPGGEIQPAALERTAAAVRTMLSEAQANRVRATVAVGTAGLRMARNRDAVLAALRAATGVTVNVISGDDEARLAYLAVVASLGLGAEPVVVFDTGGGSSQFTFGHAAEVDERFSVAVGAVRYTERFGLAKAVGPAVVGEVLAAIATDLSRLDERPKPRTLVGMGGAVTNLSAVKLGLAKYDPDVVQGAILQRNEIDRQIDLFASKDAKERRSIVGLQPNRAEVILAGACIVRCIMEKLGQEALTVSDRGLRHGVLIERFE
jgi:exopolyphosphatase/guanosine-5'-triphosphate,3'-diphosphate pyrophosphatase